MAAVGKIQEILANDPSEYEELKYTTINIGTIRGGTKASIVPDTCEIELDCRLVPEDSPEKILDLLHEKLEHIGADDPQFSYDLKVIRQNQAYQSDPQSTLVKAIQSSLEITGYKETPVPVLMSRGGGDMRYFIEKDIPCVAFGPGRRPDSNIHGTDEYLTIDDFILASKATAATLIKLLSE